MKQHCANLNGLQREMFSDLDEPKQSGSVVFFPIFLIDSHFRHHMVSSTKKVI